MAGFQVKTRIFFGPEPMAALEALAGRRVLIVTDGFLASSGLLDGVKARLTGPAAVFDQVEPDPSLALVARGVKAMADFAPEAILAFGGGSPMDCAKGMRWCAKAEIPLWCVPTTAGTGSEVTSFAVLTQDGVKYPLVHDALIPDAAVLDPALLAGVPPKVTADTGMDVLTHAAEAMVAQGAGPFSDGLAQAAFALAWRALPAAFAGELEAKRDMLYASCMAGMAFNAAGLGLCHAMAHALGGRLHLPHGRLNAMLLPHVIAFNAQAGHSAGKYARLAKDCGLAANPRALGAALARLRERLGLPARLEEALGPALPEVTQAALADICLAGNPRPAVQADVEAILKEIGG